MALRARQNFIGGLIENTPLGVGDTTLNSAALSAVSVVTNGVDYIPIVLDPEGLGGAPEIVYITAHTASAATATISRAEEGTGAREHRQDIRWVHGPTAYDFEEPVNTYTPTWSATGSAPSIGDGTLSGIYLISGKKLTFSIHLEIGSTTNLGTGEWLFTLPEGVNGATPGSIQQIVQVRAFQDAPNNVWVGNGWVDVGGNLVGRFSSGGGAAGYYGATAPFSWVAGDGLAATGEIIID